MLENMEKTEKNRRKINAMKATGIVRRIDDLGRVVVPKEIRRTLRIREGDPLEIFTDKEGEIILKKYSPIGELSAFAKQYAESLSQMLGCLAGICDMDQVVAAAGNGKKELQDEDITRELGERRGMQKQEKKICAGGEQNRTLQSGGDQSDPVCGGCDRGGTPDEHGSERPV